MEYVLCIGRPYHVEKDCSTVYVDIADVYDGPISVNLITETKTHLLFLLNEIGNDKFLRNLSLNYGIDFDVTKFRIYFDEINNLLMYGPVSKDDAIMAKLHAI